MAELAQPSTADKLAWERTWLAHERTSMAWVRTGTSLITLGFSLYKFFAFIHELEPERTQRRLLGPRTFGMVMIAIGLAALFTSAIQHRIALNRMRKQVSVPFSLAGVLSGLLTLLGILAFLAALLRD